MNTRTVARLCHFLRLHKLAYFMNRRRKRVITFHNVLSEDVFTRNVANGVSCSISSFKRIIDEIATIYPFSLDLDDPSTATITFDDGYCNQAEVAGNYLIEKGIPAYLFVSGQLINAETNQAKILTIDKLLHWVSYAPKGSYFIRIKGVGIEIIVDDDRGKLWSGTIWPLFLSDTDHKGETILSALDKAYPFSLILERLDDKYIRQRLSGVTEKHLLNLKKHGWQIGWHTQSHYPVSLLNQSDKEIELTPCDICDSKVFSYPYGGPNDADDESYKILIKNGYTKVVSNVNYGNQKLGDWYRSRMSLPDDPILLHFELSGLKYFLKYKKLLPKI